MRSDLAGIAGPDPSRVDDLPGLVRELGLLRARAAGGTPKARVSIDELARRVDQPRSTVHAYVTGKHLPASDVLDRLVIALGATPAEQRRWGEAWFRVAASVDAARRTARPPFAVEPVVPRQLPLDVDGFVGRTAELAELDGLLGAAQQADSVTICVLAGTGGVGKTALAAHWAHRVAGRFPDGQLWVDLRGFDPDQPVRPDAALAGFLRALEVAGAELPADLAERAALFRSLSDGRRLLVVLDNAGDVEQVRPLLPGSASCLVVVTSRDSLAGLVARHGARRVELDALPAPEAVELLGLLVGDRVDTDTAVTSVVAEQCARLPLALRIAAELAVANPGTSLADLADDLADLRCRMDLLDTDDPRTAVRSVFSWSYRHLPSDAARTFRLLGLHPGADIGVTAAAALTGNDADLTGRLLNRLVRVHLLHEPTPGRYAMHDLLRAWAVERATAQDSEPARTAAQARLFDHYLHAADVAMGLLYPHEQRRWPRTEPPETGAVSFAAEADARRWLDAELANLLAVPTTSGGWSGQAIRLSAVLWRHLDTLGYYAEALALHESAVDCARADLDRAGLANALSSLGTVRWRTGHFHRADQHYQEALTLFRDIGDRDGQARVLNNLGAVHQRIGEYERAIQYQREALGFRAADDRDGRARALNNLGTAYGGLSRYEEAVDQFREALTLYREIGQRSGEARALGNLGVAYCRLGRHDLAAGCHRAALDLCRQVGDRGGQTEALNGLGEVAVATGDPAGAFDWYRQARDRAEQTGDRYEQAHAHYGLANAHHQLGDLDRAREHWTHALGRYAELGVPEANEVRDRLTELDAG